MGTQLTYLNKPNKEIEMDKGYNGTYEYVAWSMQGWRTNMEDAHLGALDFEDDMHMFGVFDGHGGKEVAIYVAENLINIFLNTKQYKSEDYEKALYQTFVKIDENLATKEAKKKMQKFRDENPEGK